ncbi:hypothetical protein GCM10011369_00210 [Neiella marina]|uniref:Aminoglycoside phosphotransferase domain-containing protein n=1 Tax=Neiella marina TaxID=508461 RepID=A0A8J2U1H6_9GAMM|nr:hypothetical protein GCM10011369_00210 [Neiella marina]
MLEQLTPADCAAEANLGPLRSCRQLQQGLSHHSFHLQLADRSALFLRIYRPLRKPWIERSHELSNLMVASEQGLTPELLFIDEKQRYFISRYVEDVPMEQPSLPQIMEMIDLVAALPVTRMMNQQQRFDIYVQQARQAMASLSTDQVAPLNIELESVVELGKQALAQLHQYYWPVIPSFLDWHRGNVLMTSERAYLVDFEYLALSEMPLELASLQLSGLVSTTDWPKLQAAIEQLYGVKVADAQLGDARCLYRVMCYCWYWAVMPNEAAEPTRELVRLLTRG